jgi:hypothetical protein
MKMVKMKRSLGVTFISQTGVLSLSYLEDADSKFH